MVAVSYHTDPLCPWSWAAEPALRKLMVQFGDELRWTFVMGGLERDLLGGRRSTTGLDDALEARLVRAWLEVADLTGAPLDPLLWVENPIASSYPACMAVKAAAEQADDGGYRYLRVLREGLLCHRRKLDHAEALVALARDARLDVEHFHLALRSHAVTEAFALDLEATKALGSSVDRASIAHGAALPTVVFRSESGATEMVAGLQPYEVYRDAAVALGASVKAVGLTVEEAIARFEVLTTTEVELLCELPGPRASAELFRLAEQWKLRPIRCLTGFLWATP